MQFPVSPDLPNRNKYTNFAIWKNHGPYNVWNIPIYNILTIRQT